MAKSYERQPYDTDLSWVAFQDYLALPAPRTLDKLYRQYISDSCAKEPPTKKSRTIRGWSVTKKWASRVKDYDTDQSAIATEKAIQAHAEATVASIERFTKETTQVGRNGFITYSNLLKGIALYVKDNPVPKTIDEAGKFARMAQSIGPDSYRMYAQALGIEKILPMLELDD